MDGGVTIGAWLDRLAARVATRPAVCELDRVTTFAELAQRTRRLAGALAGLGVTKGTRLGILMPNHRDWLALALAGLRLGAWLVPLNTLWRRAELEHALRRADVQILLFTSRFLGHDYGARLAEIHPRIVGAPPGERLFLPEMPALRVACRIDGSRTDAAAQLRDAAPSATAEWRQALEAAVVPDDPAVLFFTSGTTALPKAVVHTHRSILAAASGIAARLGLDEDDRTWGYLPFFFTGGFVALALATLARGGAVLLQDRFDAGTAIELMQRYRATTFFAWPHQAEAIRAHPSFDRTALGLRKGPGAQAAWAPHLFADDHRAVGSWGMTECGPLATCSSYDDPLTERQSSHGRSQPGVEIRIVDPESGAPTAPGRTGELLVRGVTLMQQYYGHPPPACFDTEGYFHTGDLAYVEDTGLLHFVGRCKDVIKSAGVSIASAEIEAVLQSHPAVRLAYVVGIPHPTRGEDVAAFVVRRDATLPAEELLAFCTQHLATYKVPRLLHCGDEAALPVLGSGKVDKERLRALLAVFTDHS